MNKLIIDTSTYYLYVSFIKGDTVSYNKVLYGKNNHSENLMPIILECLNGFNPEDLDEIIVGIGPGSYTGVRVSLTVGKTLAWTLNKTLKTLSSLTLIASGYLKEDGVYAVSSIAKKGYVYGKVFAVENEKVDVLLDDIFLKEDEFNEKVVGYNAVRIAEGNYKFDDYIIDGMAEVVNNVHEAVPNYLRKANS